LLSHGWSQALLKIVKHCREAMPAMVAGCLVGLNVGGTLEVSNCFGYKREESGEEDTVLFQKELLHCLREVGLDSNDVGWYLSTPFSSVCTHDLVATQHYYQSDVPGSVVIVYDPTSAGAGSLSLKALRLTDSFFALYRGDAGAAASAAAGSPLLSSGVFEEVPLRVHVNPMMSALLFDIAAPTDAGSESKIVTGADPRLSGAFAREACGMLPVEGDVDCDLDRLEVTPQAYLEKYLTHLSESVEEMSELIVAAQVWDRKEAQLQKQRAEFEEVRRRENELLTKAGTKPLPMHDPSLDCFKPMHPDAHTERRDALLMAAQASLYCREIGHIASRNFGKLFLAGALHAAE
jgi:translation initiation factor 3 subunit H